MASGKSLYLSNAILDGVLGGTPYTPPSIVYVVLSTAPWSNAATGSSLSEVTGGGYSRIAVTNNATNWPAAVSGSKNNGAVFTFPTATANWGTIQSVYLVDASSGGNALYGADVDTPRTISTGDTASFAQDALTAKEA